MHRDNRLVGIPVFIVSNHNGDHNKIVQYQGLFNLLQSNLQRKILISHLHNFLDQLGKVHRTVFDKCLFISPQHMSLVNFEGEMLTSTIIQEYDWIDPAIKLDWLKIQTSTNSDRVNNKYTRFLNQYPDMRDLLTIPYYAVFQDYFEDPGFDYVYHLNKTPEINNSELRDTLEKVHPVFLPHVLYLYQSERQPTENVSEYVGDIIKYDYSTPELQFMSYLNFISASHPQRIFHHLPNLLIVVVQQHYLFQSDINYHFCFQLLSDAINMELQNTFPSSNLANYYNAFAFILDSMETKQQESTYHTYLAFHSLLNYLQQNVGRGTTSLTNDQFEVTVGLVYNTIRELLDTDVKRNSPFDNISLDTVKQALDLLFEILDLKKLSLYDQFLIIRLCYHIDIDEIKKETYPDLENLADAVIIRDIQLDIQWKTAKSIHFIILLIDYYIRYFTSSRNNPEEIIANGKYSSLLKKHWDRIFVDISSAELSKFYDFYKPIKLLPEASKIVEIIFSNKPIGKKVSALLNLLKHSEHQSHLFRLFSRRLMVFLSDNFFEVPHHLLRQFLSLWSDDKSTHTITRLMRHFLLQLLGDRDLTPEDMEFLRKYLDYDYDQTSDLGADGLADLMFTLSQLENVSDVDIDNEDGTSSKLQLKQVSQRSKDDDDSGNDPEVLPTIPSDIFDIIDDLDDLEHYLRLFFRYHSTHRKYRRGEINPEKLYYNLLDTQPDIEVLDKYHPEFTNIRKDHPQVVDDIRIEMLNIRLILQDYPSFVLPRLDELEKKLREREVPRRDWIEFMQLSLDASVKLNLYQTTDLIQIKIELLQFYNEKWKIPIHQYLDQILLIDTQLFKVIKENSSIAQLVEGVIYNEKQELPEFASQELDPFIDLLVMTRLSWENSSELQLLLRRYHDVSHQLVRKIEERSDAWNGGILIGREALMIRIVELNNDQSGVENLTTRLQEGYTNEENRIKALVIIADFYLSQKDLITSHNLLNYIITQINNLPSGKFLPKDIGNNLAEISWRAGAHDVLKLLLQHYQETSMDILDDTLTQEMSGIEHKGLLNGLFPEVDLLLKRFEVPSDSAFSEYFSKEENIDDRS